MNYFIEKVNDLVLANVRIYCDILTAIHIYVQRPFFYKHLKEYYLCLILPGLVKVALEYRYFQILFFPTELSIQ